MKPIHVVGGGLAGCEAAYAAAKAGVPVVLHEMRPTRATAAHRTARLAELVCSNSFRSDDAENNAVGVLHRELRRLGSLVMRAADAHQVPAGGALAVDRDGFSEAVEAAVLAEPLITIERGEVAGLPPAGLGSRPSSPPARSPRRRWARRSWPPPASNRSPFSTPSPPSSISTASISTSPGGNRVTTRPGPAATRRPM